MNHIVSHIFARTTAFFQIIRRRPLDYQLVDLAFLCYGPPRVSAVDASAFALITPRLPGGQLATAGALSLKRLPRRLLFNYFIRS